MAVVVLATALALTATPSSAHTPHDDIFDVAPSPAFHTDRTMLAISRGTFVRSTDGGVTWGRLVKGIDNRSQPRAVSYAGGSASRAYAVSGDAVFRSDDGGVGWQRILSPATKDLKVLATSTLPDTAVVAGAGAGFSITTDAGESWRSLGSFGSPVTAVAFKKGSAQVIFAGDAKGVLHTTGNAGATWRHHAITGAGSITSITMSPSFATDGIALIGTSAAGIFRWQHSTTTATPTSIGVTDVRVTSIAYSANYGWDNTIYATTWTGGLFVSRDRGSTWAASNSGLEWDGQTNTSGFADRPNFGRVVSALTSTVTRESQVVVAAFTGIYHSTDLGTSWVGAETLPRGIVVGLSLSPHYGTDGKVAISTYVNGAFTSSDRGATWAESNVGLAQPSLWDDAPDSYARLFNISHAPSVDGQSWLFSSRVGHGSSHGGVLRSSNGGASWSLTTVAGFSDVGLTEGRLPFVLPSPSFATDSAVLLADRGNGAVYRSTDRGASFEAVGSIPHKISCLQASPTFAYDGRIFACTNGGVYVTKDLGATWLRTANLSVSGLAVVVRNGVSETWLAATSTGLFRSTNLGMQWSRVALPSLYFASEVVAVAASPPSSAAGTVLISVPGRGVLRSTDGGTSFSAPSTALLDQGEQFDNFNRPTASAIVFSPAFTADSTIFGFSHDHLLRSTDGGVTWARVTVPLATHPEAFPVAPSAPTIGEASPGAGAASVAFTPGSDGGAPVLHFDGVCTSSDGGATGTGSSTASPVVVTGLTSGKTYTCRATATTGIGTSPPSGLSNAVVPTPPLGAPTAVTAVAGVGEATVSWTAPEFDGGSPITGYRVQAFVGYFPLAPVTFSSTATTQTMTGLAGGTTYRFKVTALTEAATSAASGASNPVVPISVPGAPTGAVAAVGVGGGEATVSWTAPASDGGSPITGYVVQAFVGYFPLEPETFSSTATTQTMTGLAGGTTYRFRVWAVNAVGMGPASLGTNPVTLD